MEPRPQRPRPTSGQTQGIPTPPSAGGSSTSPYQPGYQESGEPDPTAFIAPPRTEYDYSPLDLAPPGQRRKRQLVVGIVGLLALVVIGGLLVVGYLFLRDDNNEQPIDEVALAQTVIANATGTPSADGETVSTETVTTGGETDSTATVTSEANSTATESGGTQTQPTVAPSSAASNGDQAGPTITNLKKLLPTQDMMPVGLDVPTDTEFDEATVVENLGGGSTVEQNLTKWGWSGNVGRSFEASDPASLDPTATTALTVSVHGFSTATNAASALTFFSDALVDTGGWQEVDAPELGGKARMLVQTMEDGTTSVNLYIQDGRTLYRIVGYAPAGDPTQTVIDLATTLIND